MEDFKVDLGMASTKARWERRKEMNEYRDLSAQDKELREEEEARERSLFDPLIGEIDLTKRKQQKTAGSISPSLSLVQDEANINVREQTYQSIFNLSKAEITGLTKFEKRVDNGNGTIMITETDESGKLAILLMEAYME